MERKMLCVGDPPETGGAVLPFVSSPPFKVHERQVAVIGGKASCQACKSVGIIAKAGDVYRIRIGNELAALDQDILLCKCKNPPKMRALHAATQWVDDHNTGGSAKMFVSESPLAKDQAVRYDQHFIIRDQSTGKPFGDFLYGLKTPDGEHHGQLGEDGTTVKASADSPQQVTLMYLLQTRIGVR